MKKVLIVGAGGFMGARFAAIGLEEGYEVWCGVRASTSRKCLADPRLKFVEFDFEEPGALEEVLHRCATLDGRSPGKPVWDYIIYNLGATKALRYSDFERVNTLYLRRFIEALKEVASTVSSDILPERILYMSSLSVMGPGDEKGFSPFTETMVPIPNTRYGASKLKAEMELAASGLPYIIFRPTGIYGPGDRDYLLMLRSLQKGFSFSAGLSRQELTFIYADDLAHAAYAALEHAPVASTYLLAEDRSYTQKEYRRMGRRAVGKKRVMSLTVPLWGVKMVSAIAEKIGAARGKPSTLNSDKYRIMAQRNWRVDCSAARRDFGFEAPTPLEKGLEKSVEWYRAAGWMK